MRAAKILLPVILLSALLATSLAVAPTPQATPTDITAVVAAWNIEAFNPMEIG